MMGLKPETVAREIGPLVEGVGANCGRDPEEYIGFVHALRQAAPEAIIWVKPNAGLPHLVEDEIVYDATPATMGQVALKLQEAGAQVVGGCCGTTPEHVTAVASALKASRFDAHRLQATVATRAIAPSFQSLPKHMEES
jgi:5-methyltetrahydrofolate--homocysteine methyltransferase